VAAAIIIVFGAGLWFLQPRRNTVPAAEQPLFSVARGALTISVSEAGMIKPREQIILKSEVEGSTVILSLVKEGKRVKKGELLVELDASSLEDKRVSQQIQVINAEAAYINARENLAVVRSQTQADLEQAELDLQFARQDLTQYRQGEYPKQSKNSEATITLAEQTLNNARNTYDWSLKLYQEKYISEAELKKDELSLQKANIDLDLARDDYALLQDYTYKRRITELEAAIKQKDRALQNLKRKNAADLAQAEAKLKASDAEFKQQQDKFSKIETQIRKTKIYAPMDGTVIYATSTRMNWRGNTEPLDEGQAVRERQELIYLPTTSSYDAEIKVHESSLKKIHPGQPVNISIDALPGQQFHGLVTSIAPLPDATSMFMNPDLKVYNTNIEIDGSGGELRNGMSCRAEIIIDQIADTLFVPLQAVTRDGGQTIVYRPAENGPRVQPVTTGQDNNRMIEIVAGLAAGDQVLLTPPLASPGHSGPGRNLPPEEMPPPPPASPAGTGKP